MLSGSLTNAPAGISKNLLRVLAERHHRTDEEVCPQHAPIIARSEPPSPSPPILKTAPPLAGLVLVLNVHHRRK